MVYYIPVRARYDNNKYNNNNSIYGIVMIIICRRRDNIMCTDERVPRAQRGQLRGRVRYDINVLLNNTPQIIIIIISCA